MYLRSEIPEKWGVRNAKYAFDILAVAQKGYILCGYVNSSKQEPKWPSSCITKGYIGIHGYSPEMVDMRGIFYARGPGTFWCKSKSFLFIVSKHIYLQMNSLQERICK